MPRYRLAEHRRWGRHQRPVSSCGKDGSLFRRSRHFDGLDSPLRRSSVDLTPASSKSHDLPKMNDTSPMNETLRRTAEIAYERHFRND